MARSSHCKAPSASTARAGIFLWNFLLCAVSPCTHRECRACIQDSTRAHVHSSTLPPASRPSTSQSIRLAHSTLSANHAQNNTPPPKNPAYSPAPLPSNPPSHHPAARWISFWACETTEAGCYSSAQLLPFPRTRYSTPIPCSIAPCKPKPPPHILYLNPIFSLHNQSIRSACFKFSDLQRPFSALGFYFRAFAAKRHLHFLTVICPAPNR